MPRPTELMKAVDDSQLTEIAKDIEKRLIAAIDKSV